MFFLYVVRYLPTLEIIQLKQIALIDRPVEDLRITEICFLSKINVFIIFKFLNKKIGNGLELPKGPNLLTSSTKLVLIEDEDNSKSYFNIKSEFRFFFKKSF